MDSQNDRRSSRSIGHFLNRSHANNFHLRRVTAIGDRGPLQTDWQESLFDEGYAMLRAVAEDFSQLPDWEARIAWRSDREVSNELKSFGTIVFFPEKVKALLRKESRAADATLVIAPECDGLRSDAKRLRALVEHCLVRVQNSLHSPAISNRSQSIF